MTGGIPVRWLPRPEPLAPAAAMATGAAVRRLAARLLWREDGALARLRGVAGPDLLLLLGPAEELPWIDGVSYLGVDPAAPALLLPTTLAPSVPPALLERALLRGPGREPPLALLVHPGRPLQPFRVASAARALPIAPSRILSLAGAAR